MSGTEKSVGSASFKGSSSIAERANVGGAMAAWLGPRRSGVQQCFPAAVPLMVCAHYARPEARAYSREESCHRHRTAGRGKAGTIAGPAPALHEFSDNRQVIPDEARTKGIEQDWKYGAMLCIAYTSQIGQCHSPQHSGVAGSDGPRSIATTCGARPPRIGSARPAARPPAHFFALCHH